MKEKNLTQQELVNLINKTNEYSNVCIVYFDTFDKSIGLPPGEYKYFDKDDKYYIIRDTDIFTYKQMLNIINKQKALGYKGNEFIPIGLYDFDKDIEYKNKEVHEQ